MTTLETLYRKDPEDARVRSLVARWVMQIYDRSIDVREHEDYKRMAIVRVQDDPDSVTREGTPTNVLYSVLYANYQRACCERDMLD